MRERDGESGSGDLAALRPGARIALVAPASPPVAANVDAALAMLRSWGYEPVEMPHVRAVDPDLPYLAGTDAQRAADVMDALTDDRIDAVMCARGGYGSARILPLLDADAIRAARPKPFFGSSDITAMHDWLFECTGRRTWFSPMPATDAVLDDPAAAAMLRDAMAGRALPSIASREPQRLAFGGASVADAAAAVSGTTDAIGTTDAPGLDDATDADNAQSAPRETIRVRGRLRGGNLSLLAAGTSAGVRGPLASDDPRGPKFREPTILLIEDVHEKPYHIDEMLRQLVAAGWFRNVTGIMLGSWLGCDGTVASGSSSVASSTAGPTAAGQRPVTPPIIANIARDILGPLGIPVAAGFDFGHGPGAHTLPLGAVATLRIRRDGADASFDVG
ncbi:LD-carboxypeptidase [Bifidobacterium sp. 82T10]|uniref:LD-carboxypeptidase n=1 Tax=Bifidobacterium miconis TaxID=2834435 RepID=A0ABS6WDC1_9BIFI|nr:LD-carboxypeptidase [Bifidobacterium miconis]MBW3092051.1 LD-carboxypeptidase [Bifidobacterium miconis]